MIDVNDLNKLDCEKALIALANATEQVNRDYLVVEDFIDQVKDLQRKYTKPIAALLKGPNG